MKTLGVSLVLLGAFAFASTAQPNDDLPEIRKVTVSDGIELHYIEKGKGVPVVFVHGALEDCGYWTDEIAVFANSGYRAIAYSRRYNPPNTNEARPGYSAVVDAADLAGLIEKLHLGKVHIVGHSYGALTALFLAVKHPDLVRTLVLAEAPAVSLLEHLPGDRAEIGKATFADVQERMVKPMKAAFQKGDREAGLRAFIGYISGDPLAWEKMPDAAREDVLEHAHEWDVMMTTGEFFPELDPAAVRKIQIPALLLSGEKSYPFLKLIDEDLERLLPHGQRIILAGATHNMWVDQPETCRKAVLVFWRQTEHKRRPLRAAHLGAGLGMPATGRPDFRHPFPRMAEASAAAILAGYSLQLDQKRRIGTSTIVKSLNTMYLSGSTMNGCSSSGPTICRVVERRRTCRLVSHA